MPVGRETEVPRAGAKKGLLQAGSPTMAGPWKTGWVLGGQSQGGVSPGKWGRN
jgi:hypothetical protein